MKLSIVVPVYNEAATILSSLRRVQLTPYEKEIIVVDDGSTDGTRDVLATISDSTIRVFFHTRNQGKGAALRTAFAQATGDFVIVQDADLEYDPDDYPNLLEPLLKGDADVVYGSRFLSGPKRVLFFWHMVGNQMLTLLSNMTTNLNLTDMETGYKAFRLDVVRKLELTSNRFTIEPEITAKVARLRCRVYEVPISYHGRTYDEGKKIGWRDGISAVAAILRFGLLPESFNRGKVPEFVVTVGTAGAASLRTGSEAAQPPLYPVRSALILEERVAEPAWSILCPKLNLTPKANTLMNPLRDWPQELREMLDADELATQSLAS